ncbi:50S ribosomal protein L17 [Candidatus Marinamargulisbacteria bacterium SCGC AG-410-N11]|nr:50S ribosomal protein L17 [Candidatus Marinamargulisbacteria bacterium SCGC AG-410-N11]
MRHRKSNNKLSKPTDQRIAMLKALSRSLINNGKIITTAVRAKAVQSYVEKLISASKDSDLASKRHILKKLPQKDTFKKLTSEVSIKYSNRNGGFTRIVKLSKRRKGDGAPMSLIELVE